MPQYGPFQLSGDQGSGSGLEAALGQLRTMFPGMEGVTSYAGAPGSIAALGFTHPRNDLFPGQPPSSLNALFSAPGAIGQTLAPPESVTSALAQSAPMGATGPPLGGSEGTGGMAPGTESNSAGPLGNYGGLNSFMTTAAGNTPAAYAGGKFGLSPGVSNTALNVASGIFGLNAVPTLNQMFGIGSTLAQGPATTTDFSHFGPGELGPSAADFSSTAAENATTTALGLAGPAGAFGNVGFAYSGSPTGFVGPATGRTDTPEASPAAPAASPEAEAAAAAANAEAGQSQGQASGGGGGGGGK